MGPPTVSGLAVPPYPNMNTDTVNRNLAQISHFSSRNNLESTDEGELEVPKERVWFARFRSPPYLDPAVVERTYEIALLLKQQPEKRHVFLEIQNNFDTSLKGLDKLIVYFDSRDSTKSRRLKQLQIKVLNDLAQIELNQQDWGPQEVPPPPPMPPVESLLPRKPHFKRRPQSVCLVNVDLERNFMRELFDRIKKKAPVKEVEPAVLGPVPLENQVVDEWEVASAPVPMPEPVILTASVVRGPLQRTVSYYDKRTPLYDSSIKCVNPDPVEIQKQHNLIRNAMLSRRRSISGKGIADLE